MKKLLTVLLFISLNANAQLFKTSDGTHIHYEIMGGGRPVVLLHGFIVSSNSWKTGALPKKLSEEGFKVILVDLRGNGLSDKPQDLMKYQHLKEINDVIELMKSLKIKEYDVVGYSRGAILAAKMISMDKHIRTVTLGGINLDFTNPDWERRRDFMDIFSGKAHLHPQLKGAVDYAKKVNADTLVLGYLQKVQPIASLKEMRKFKKPVLVISGSEDVESTHFEQLAKVFLNSTLRIVAGKNHNNTSSSEDFSNDVLSFLKSH